jgi:uncharacterized protein YndB with AHSA1/START domain
VVVFASAVEGLTQLFWRRKFVLCWTLVSWTNRVSETSGEKMAHQKVQIEATVAAALPKVWQYYTNPQHITQWNFAVPEWHCPRATNDLRVGGKYNARMEAKDGSFGFDFEAVYDEVAEQKKLVYTLGDGRKVITNFEPAGTSTKVTTVFDAENQNPIEMQKNGWQAILNNFKKYTEES